MKQDGIDYIDRPGVYALIEGYDKRIAVIETSKGYFLPGGGIDSGESEVEALKREITEEIGCHCSVLIELGIAVEYIKSQSDEKYYQIRSKFYKVHLDSLVRESIEKDHRLVWLLQEDAVKLLTRQGQVWAVKSMIKTYRHSKKKGKKT